MNSNTVDFSQTPFVKGAVGATANRLNWRAELIMNRNAAAIKGCRVLDMACADARFVYAALRYGAAHVTGVEGRRDQVSLGRRWLKECGIDDRQFDLEVGDAVDYLFACEVGQFDTILCLGFLYHTVRQVEILQQMARLKPRTLIIDTTVARGRWYRRPGKFVHRFRANHLLPREAIRLWRSIEGDEVMFFGVEETSKPSTTMVANLRPEKDWLRRNAPGARFVPTGAMVERLLEMHGFSYEEVDWRRAGIDNWTALDDYRKRERITLVATPNL